MMLARLTRSVHSADRDMHTVTPRHRRAAVNYYSTRTCRPDAVALALKDNQDLQTPTPSPEIDNPPHGGALDLD